MNQPEIIVLHKLPNRIRVKLSHPLRDINKAITIIKEGNGIIDVSYNTITKSILIYFNHIKIEAEEVLLRIAIAYSKQYDMVPIKLLSNTPTRDMPHLAHYSILSILTAFLSKSLGFSKNKNVQDFINWIAVGTTIGSIVEHGYKELNEKGAFDPEVVSVMYLINSIGKNNFIGASAIAWIATFGRHLLNFYYEGVSIKITEIKNILTNEICYDVSIYETNDMSKKVNFLESFLANFIGKQNPCCRNNIIMTKQGTVNSTSNIYCTLDNSPNKISFSTNYGNKLI